MIQTVAADAVAVDQSKGCLDDAAVVITVDELKNIWGVSGQKLHDNANMDDANPETMHKRIADIVSSEAALKLIPPWLAELHESGTLHIHDLDAFATKPFCYSTDLRYILFYGLMPDGVGNRLPVAGPAKNPEVAVLHAAKALGCSQTCYSGGQGFHNFNLFLSPYFYGLHYEEIKQLMQMFVYEMSQMIVARGAQAVFSSVQLAPGVPRAWRDVRAVYKGHISDKTYKEFEREVRLSYKAFIEVMLEGDYWGKPFNFPKPEIALMWEFMGDDWDKPLTDDCCTEIVVAPSYQELYKLTFELAAKQGTPYFDNQLPAYRDAEGGINCFQCCAYNQRASARCDLNFNRKLHFVNGYHFDDMGSCQVVSLNLPRAAYRACRMTDDIRFRGMILKDRLEDLVDKAVEIFLEKRQYMRKAPLPFIRQTPKGPDGKTAPPLTAVYKLGFVIGLVGVNEMVQALTGKQLHEGRDAWLFALRIIEDLNTYVNQVSKESGLKITLSRTPAETTAQRFAVCDLRDGEFKDRAMQVIKGDINTALRKAKDTNDLPIYYSNGTHLYVGAHDSSGQPVTIFDRALLEGPFFPLVDGGNIFHIFLGEKDPDPEALMDFCLTIAKETDIGYFSITRDMTVCKECHKVSPGLRATCPGCDSNNIDHISRITGYLQAVSGWNSAKRQELRDRKRTSI